VAIRLLVRLEPLVALEPRGDLRVPHEADLLEPFDPLLRQTTNYIVLALLPLR